MSITIAELKNRIASSLDECDILDLLKIDSYKLVELLEDEIIDKYDDILPELEKFYEEDDTDDDNDEDILDEIID